MRKFREPFVVVKDPHDTKSKILLEAAKLFAVKGYSAVSVRDIARAADILPGSLYNHYRSKQDILESMLNSTLKELDEFYYVLEQENKNAQSFEEILRNIFVELKEYTNRFSQYSLWCAICTQFSFEASEKLFYQTFLHKGKEVMKRQLDLAVEKNLVKPFYTEGLASIISSSVIMMMPIHVGFYNGFYQDFDITGWYEGQIKFMLETVEQYTV